MDDKLHVKPLAVDLIVQDLPEETQPTPHETDTGALVILNDDDDDGDGAIDVSQSGTVPGENDLVRMDLRLPSEVTAGTVTLAATLGADKIRVWTNSDRSGSGPLIGGTDTEETWNVGSHPATLWIEGVAESLAWGDVQFALNLQQAGQPRRGDNANVAVGVWRIHPPATNSAITVDSPLNAIRNPAAVVIESDPAPNTAARFEFTQVFRPFEGLPEDDDRVRWTIQPAAGSNASADFLQRSPIMCAVTPIGKAEGAAVSAST